MKTYLSYKNQLEKIEDVSETVKTVEKIAASSVHFLRQEVLDLNVYAAEVEKMLIQLSLFYQKKHHSLLQGNATGIKALVVITGDRGLVGGLWHRVVGAFLDNAKQYQSVIVIGAKGEYYLQEESAPIIKSFAHFSDIPKKEEIEYVTNYIFDEFKKGAFSRIDILYPQFVSLAEQTPNFIPFLPFEFKLIKEKKSGGGLPIFEPSKQKVFGSLLRKYIEIFFYKIIMETKLSEFSSRTAAMEHAVAKTKRLAQKLSLEYMKQRHRIITQRQLENFVAHKITRAYDLYAGRI